MPKNTDVLAFFWAMSMDPTQASSMRWNALRLPPESTTAMHIWVPSSTAFARAAAIAVSACSIVTCMGHSRSRCLRDRL